MHDIKRTAVTSVTRLLNQFPCVAILGARQVGKTTLLKQVRPEAPFFDLERQDEFERIKRDPDLFLSQYKQPIVIDESQLLPELFNALRVAIDAKRDLPGSYLLSGSSSPELLTKISESLAGRIATFELGGFNLEESWHLNPSPFYDCIEQENIAGLLELKPRLTINQLLENCLFGRFPEPWLKYRHDPAAFSLWAENYFRSYIRRDIRNIFAALNIHDYQRFVSMLAGSTSQVLNASEFARSLDISQPTAKSYFQIAHGTFIWRLITSFHKNTIKRIVKAPKGYMRDSGLANYLLKNRGKEQLQTHHLFGRIWEAFIIEELIQGFENRLIPAEPFFYRTHNQAEIDLVLEGNFGILPIEIKAGGTAYRRGFAALEQFVKRHNLKLGLLINNSSQVAWLSKNILQIPAGCL